jgi:GH15 family glucan-1,4-alpha-glucosidase
VPPPPSAAGDVSSTAPYPRLTDYALIGDCHSAALVSRDGSIDWCCMPRFDSGSVFGRLLDWEKGGTFTLRAEGAETSPGYLGDTLVLATEFRAEAGTAVVYDAFARHEDGPLLLRIVEGRRGKTTLSARIAPRFDYGEVHPWIRRDGPELLTATGGDDALAIWSDADLAVEERHDLVATFDVRAGERVRFAVRYVQPEDVEDGPAAFGDPAALDRVLEDTLHSWREWSAQTTLESAGARRSALIVKALTYEPTGALVAAPTTSLPESPGGERNWDYRYSWIRDSIFSVRALAEAGHEAEADAFRRFIQRSAAGHAAELQVLYGPGGERRLDELELSLEGYRGARPVRAGNSAAGQLQLDAFGEIVNLVWRWHRRGHSPDDDAWRFVADVVELALEHWDEPDSGLWEWRGDPRHFVHSKAMCWIAADRGLQLAEECLRQAPRTRWKKARDEIRDAVDADGCPDGVFVQAFGRPGLDAAALLLPSAGYVAYDDERMVATADAVREELGADGLVLRYSEDDGLGGEEGAFLACSFWLAEVLARQDRLAEARATFDRALAAASPLGLFSEESDPRTGEALGNYPQGLTHLSHINAAMALAELSPAGQEPVAGGAAG